MVFSDPSFLFYFLPLALTTYWLGGWRKRNYFLLIISLVFYTAGGSKLVLLLVASGLLTYTTGLLLNRFPFDSKRKITLNLAVFALLVSLVIWKYLEFVLLQLSNLLQGLGFDSDLGINLVLPIAISFYTFQCISYLVDVSRGDIKAERNIVTFLCYILFFPHLLAGPVVRYKDVVEQLSSRPSMLFNAFAVSSPRFFWGLAKKVLIADQAAQIANAVFGIAGYQIKALDTVVGVVAYSIQIYFDFSGYSDMAIALAGMFGIKFKENFLRPYSASSVTDFWRRWHISLSSWFRDYLYIPLGGNRRGAFLTYRNLVVVFVLTGFWHGANWTFLTWGLLHGSALVIERLFLEDKDDRGPLSSILMKFWMLFVVMLGWLVFRSADLLQAVELLGALGGGAGFGISPIVRAAMTPQRVFWTCLGMTIFFLPREQSFGEILNDATSHRAFSCLAIIAGLLASVYVLSSSFSPFLYFQF